VCAKHFKNGVTRAIQNFDPRGNSSVTGMSSGIFSVPRFIEYLNEKIEAPHSKSKHWFHFETSYLLSQYHIMG